MLYQCTECRCWWNDEGESGEWPTEEEHIERTVGVLRSLRMEPVAERLLALKARAEAAEKALHELTEPISDAGHTTADGLRHELQQVRARAEAAEKRVIELEAELDLATQHMSDMGTKL
jgi:chromosome segregation ATPase